MKKNQITTALIIFVFLLIFYIFLIKIKFFLPWLNISNDFFDYWVGTKLFWIGKNIYGVNPDFINIVKSNNLEFLWGTGYSYPPYLLMFFWPLIYLNALQASYIWLFINTFLFGLFIFLNISKVKKIKDRLIISIYCLTFLPALFSIANGQINIFILYFLWFYLESNNQLVKALGITTASLIKVYPVLFFVKDLLLKKSGLILKSFLIAVFASILLLLIGKERFIFEYFTQVLPSLNNSHDAYFTNQSINGLFSRMFTDWRKNKLFIPNLYITFANIFISITSILFLIKKTLKKHKNKYILSLLWLAVITITAGKNSFWNFTPCILIGIYLIKNWGKLNLWQKKLFLISTIISNFFWLGTFGLKEILPVNIVLWGFLYSIFSSLGFLYLLLQIIILFNIYEKSSA